MHRRPFPMAALLAAGLSLAGCGNADDRFPATGEASVPTPLRAEVAIETTARPRATAYPTSVMRGDGGGEEDADDLEGPSSFPTFDPAEMASQGRGRSDPFNGDSGAGDGEVGDRVIGVRLAPEGCAPPGGGPAHGTFTVGVSGEIACGAFGETVVVNGAVVVFGTAGDDVLGAERIPAGMPALVFGFEGDDLITIPDGTRALAYGGAGGDTMRGGGAGNLLMGGPGDDNLSGGSGEDKLHGEDGADTLTACPDDGVEDHVWGEAGLDAFAIAFLADVAVDRFEDRLAEESVTPCDAVGTGP